MGTLASLIGGLASGETAAALRRARTAAIVYLLAGSAACLGLGFLVAAAFMWAERRYGPIEAALGFGAGFLVAGGLVLLAYKVGAGARARREAKRRKADLTALGVTAAAALLPALARIRPGPGLILGPLAAVAAYALYRENVRPPAGDGDPDAGP